MASLRRISDTVHEMHWYGAPSTPVEPRAQGAVDPASYGCTLFAAVTPDGHRLVGRNFDWDPSPLVVVHSHLGPGRRSLSLMDTRTLGMEGLDLDDAADRRTMLRAQGGLFDGMNEAGLFIGLAADEVGNPAPGSFRRAGTQIVSGLGFLRLVLDHCRTVEQAVELLRRHSLDFSGGPPLHYLVSDARGGSAVLEVVGGLPRVVRRPAGQTWQCMENFNLTGIRPGEWRDHRRYGQCAARLSSTGGRIDESGAFQLLGAVRQGHTQWSSVYDLTTRRVAVVAAEDVDRRHRFTV